MTSKLLQDDALISKLTAYMIQAHINYTSVETKLSAQEYDVVAFTYPGQPMGYAYAWSPSVGMVWTVNELFPTNTQAPGR